MDGFRVLETLFQVIATSTISAGIVAYLSKSLLSLWLSKDLEAHKANLRAESDREIEGLKASLAKANLEHQITFTRLHEKRAHVIATVYANLEKTHLAMRDWTQFMRIGPPPDMAALRERAIAAHSELVEYYYLRAIWLDKETCEKLNEILGIIGQPFFDFAFHIDNKGFPLDRDAWRAAEEAMTKKLPAARALLDDRFRKILGVTDH